MSDLDPASWPTWVKLVAGWGPLGIWAYISEIRRVRAERAHHESRDRCAAEMKQAVATHTEELAQVVARHEAEAQKMRDAHIRTVLTLHEENRKEMREVTTHLVGLIKKQSLKSQTLVAKVNEKKLLSSGDSDDGDGGT